MRSRRLWGAGLVLLNLLLPALPVAAQQGSVQQDCLRYSERLGSVKAQSCDHPGWYRADALSRQGRPILLRDLPADSEYAPRVLVVGGIHGDELSAISIVFDWLRRLDADGGAGIHWRLTPSMNPDGLFARPASRTNAAGVDLNRNLPTPQWERFSRIYWERRTGRNPRRYPGEQPLSEPETQWLAAEIEAFRPHVIVSVHAPYGIVDFDGPAAAPRRIGHLSLNLLGTYPGSLGNYAGVQRGISVLTVELPSAGIMPSESEMQAIWTDLGHWVLREIRQNMEPLPPQRVRTAQDRAADER